ncbi:unnamed protein product [Acanthoscelides obtectus]|uniref:Uncharacterized protein n=1 Tax=Acanthoscelides obtectus TaxID=200917 RepID=A0A9P0QE80_ACAOB|nr:unnamed protein product [Acanthoscelides obtectus]CAH2018427.1 unnamed protein product [Acanthoscelides obtectus]CAK1649132.1 hypothetical protein AOBTE_LOCUS16060 [Acanthoscelides obtectus]CAK1649151.1 hypothetical protein AOBTE_LOCUS16075 [Acanthoscelides obtectus]
MHTFWPHLIYPPGSTLTVRDGLPATDHSQKKNSLGIGNEPAQRLPPRYLETIKTIRRPLKKNKWGRSRLRWGNISRACDMHTYWTHL